VLTSSAVLARHGFGFRKRLNSRARLAGALTYRVPPESLDSSRPSTTWVRTLTGRRMLPGQSREPRTHDDREGMTRRRRRSHCLRLALPGSWPRVSPRTATPAGRALHGTRRHCCLRLTAVSATRTGVSQRANRNSPQPAWRKEERVRSHGRRRRFGGASRVLCTPGEPRLGLGPGPYPRKGSCDSRPLSPSRSP
jgi:hypothetical protein